MSHARAARSTLQRTRRGRTRIATGRPHPRSVRRVLLAMLGAPLAIRIIVAAAVAVAVWLALNWAYQVIRKPTELFFPVSGALTKAPPETWRQYGPLFLRHSTSSKTQRAGPHSTLQKGWQYPLQALFRIPPFADGISHTRTFRSNPCNRWAGQDLGCSLGDHHSVFEVR